MASNNKSEFLILIKDSISIDNLVKPLAKKVSKEILHQIKWMDVSEHKINDLPYLAINLNPETVDIIKKLKKQEWIFSHNYILRDKFHDENHKIINSELGFYKYKLLNTILHCFNFEKITAVENNLWQLLDAEKQGQLTNFLNDLRKKRKVNFLVLNEIFLEDTEKKIANKICEQANDYRKHYSLLRMGQELIKNLGAIINIIDFYLEKMTLIFIIKDQQLSDIDKLRNLEIVKKVMVNITSGVIKIKLWRDLAGFYQILKKIIKINPNNFRFIFE